MRCRIILVCLLVLVESLCLVQSASTSRRRSTSQGSRGSRATSPGGSYPRSITSGRGSSAYSNHARLGDGSSVGAASAITASTVFGSGYSANTILSHGSASSQRPGGTTSSAGSWSGSHGGRSRQSSRGSSVPSRSSGRQSSSFGNDNGASYGHSWHQPFKSDFGANSNNYDLSSPAASAPQTSYVKQIFPIKSSKPKKPKLPVLSDFDQESNKAVRNAPHSTRQASPRRRRARKCGPFSQDLCSERGSASAAAPSSRPRLGKSSPFQSKLPTISEGSVASTGARPSSAAPSVAGSRRSSSRRSSDCGPFSQSGCSDSTATFGPKPGDQHSIAGSSVSSRSSSCGPFSQDGCSSMSTFTFGRSNSQSLGSVSEVSSRRSSSSVGPSSSGSSCGPFNQDGCSSAGSTFTFGAGSTASSSKSHQSFKSALSSTLKSMFGNKRVGKKSQTSDSSSTSQLGPFD